MNRLKVMGQPRKKGPRKRVTKKPAARAKAPTRDRVSHLNPKLAALLRKRFPEKGRAERIARGTEALRKAMEVGATFKKLDTETITRIAEDPDLGC